MEKVLAKGAPAKTRRGELLDEVKDQFRRRFLAFGVEEAKATRAAEEAVTELCELWGGQTIYFPRGIGQAAEKLREQILAGFAGDNAKALAMELQVSEQYVYMVVRQARAVSRALARRRESMPHQFNGEKSK